jgi:hypothetical protein
MPNCSENTPICILRSLKCIMCLVILCIVQNLSYAQNNNIKSQPLSPKIPQTKLGNKADKMELGSCNYLDYYIYYCKPHTCSLNMPIPGRYKLTFNVKGQDSKKICNLHYSFDIVNKQGDKMPLKIKCELTQSGIEAMRYQWKYYSSGYVDVFTRRSEDPLLKKQCQATVEM